MHHWKQSRKVKDVLAFGHYNSFCSFIEESNQRKVDTSEALQVSLIETLRAIKECFNCCENSAFKKLQ